MKTPTPTDNELDFIVIGAAKSGTTTLFELAKDHPQLAMPQEKEVPFFDDDTLFSRGIKWYVDRYFAHTPSGKKKGTITPQYMLGKDNTGPQLVAERIKQTLPHTKLVVLLRNPVERAHSHYRMLAQRGHFDEPFDEATDKLLHSDKLDWFRSHDIDDSNSFLLGSEYGRILSYYYSLFDSKNILVLYTEDLKTQPEKVMQQFFHFLEVDENFVSDNLGKEFRKGGSRAKLKLLTPGFLYKIPLVETAWKNYTPYPLRKRVEYSINLWNIKPEQSSFHPGSPIYKQLVNYYRSDVELLKKMTKTTPPWLDW